MLRKTIIIFIGLISLSLTTIAKKVPGYIITDKLDTVYGEVKLSKFNILDGGWFVIGFNEEPLYFEVWFKSNADKRFKRYPANKIAGYGFSFNSFNYIFKSFEIESNTFIKKEKKRTRFLKLYHYGKICLYSDMSRITTYENIDIEPYNVMGNNSFINYDYYLYNDFIGLTKVEKSKQTSSISDLLHLYDLDKNFIEILPRKIDFNDIKIILLKYELWLKNNKSIEI